MIFLEIFGIRRNFVGFNKEMFDFLLGNNGSEIKTGHLNLEPVKIRSRFGLMKEDRVPSHGHLYHRAIMKENKC